MSITGVGSPDQNVNCLPTAVGAIASGNAFASAVMARHPVHANFDLFGGLKRGHPAPHDGG
jgi:hypothetical protein